ncbi:hypothetical protein MUK42_28662 [Musa troglodytarum]|uniref:Uncharacterized protein n=1 Tax=Musa troglodytarum TaxID=320322 RepID=A0A9E7GD99_9LILI|nr:hypothetical protein MUK42_28662 [Musa troglodytarum]
MSKVTSALFGLDLSHTLITQPAVRLCLDLIPGVDSSSPLRPNAVQASTGFHLFRERSKQPSREDKVKAH